MPELKIKLGYANDIYATITQVFTQALTEMSPAFAEAWAENIITSTANWTKVTQIADHANNTGSPGYAQIGFVRVTTDACLCNM